MKTLNPRIYAGLLAVRSDDEHVETLRRARDRADRPGVREPLSVRARVGAARGRGRRGDREHRHRRPDADPGGGEEPRVRGGGRHARELRRRARRSCARVGRRAVAAARARASRWRRSPTPRATTRRSRAGSPSARTTSRRQYTRSLREGARPALRREPAPAGGLLRRGRARARTCCRWCRSCTARSCRSTTCSTSTRAGAWWTTSSCRPRRSSSTTTRAARRWARASDEAFDKALATDRRAPSAASFCFNRPVERSLAEKLNSMFLEVVFAPGYDEDALEVLEQKPNVRLLENQERRRSPITEHDMKRVRGGLLVQDRDTGLESARGDAGRHASASPPRRSGASCCSRCGCASTCARTRSCCPRGSARPGSARAR